MRILFIIAIALMLVLGVGSGVWGEGNVYDNLYSSVELKDGVREISYEQFSELRSSGESYRLLDVLLTDSYNSGHIPGAESFPVTDINEASASGKLSKDDNLVVYCGSFRCQASVQAAKALTALGYRVLDYKGGLKEWQEKGNELAS